MPAANAVKDLSLINTNNGFAALTAGRLSKRTSMDPEISGETHV